MFLSGRIQGIHPTVSQLHSQLQPRSTPFSWLSFIPANFWDGINGWNTRIDGSRHQNSFQKTLSAHVTKAHFLQLLSTTFPHYSKPKILIILSLGLYTALLTIPPALAPSDAYEMKQSWAGMCFFGLTPSLLLALGFGISGRRSPCTSQ